MKLGVILARLQPIHNGHIALIEKSMAENETTLVLVGSADKFNKRNPIPIDLRLDLANKALKHLETKYNHKLIIQPLDDLSDETNNTYSWGFYLFTKIINLTHELQFTLYYSDGFEILTTWFPPFMFKDNISLCLMARNTFADKSASATLVRETLLKEDDDTLRTLVPPCVFDVRDTLRNFIKVSQYM
jgi:nicotinamide-nucleotide adenylyltransferase